MSKNLFEQISNLTTHTTRILLAPGERVYDENINSSYSVPAKEAKGNEIIFDIHAITPNQSILADSKITAKPPQVFEEHPNPKGVGIVRVMVGYDDQDPSYIALIQTQKPMRDAYIALMGCELLFETAPGNTLDEKANSILEKFPAFIVEFLALNIERISIYNRVGNDDVESFLAAGSDDTNTNTSKSSSGRSQASKKKQPSKSSTARTRNTKSAKRRGSGAA